MTLAREIEAELRDRYFELDEPSIEAYVPAPLYAKAGLDRDDVLDRLNELRGNFQASRVFKAETARSVADVLTPDDLDLIPTIRDAAWKAADVVNALPRVLSARAGDDARN